MFPDITGRLLEFEVFVGIGIVFVVVKETEFVNFNFACRKAISEQCRSYRRKKIKKKILLIFIYLNMTD